MTYPQQPHPGQYPQHQQYQAPPQQPQQPQQGGMGRVMVNTAYFPLGFFLAFTGPTVTINGHEQQVPWGWSPIDLPAGQYHLRVHTRYLGQLGPAELNVVVYPGQTVPVYYKAPAVMGVRGAAGFTPQQTPGMIPMIALTLLSVLFLVLVLVLV